MKFRVTTNETRVYEVEASTEDEAIHSIEDDRCETVTINSAEVEEI